MTLLSLDKLYAIAGLLLAYVAVRAARHCSGRQRVGTALFWGALSAIFLFGDLMPPVVVGWLLCALVALAAARRVTAAPGSPVTPEQRAAAAARIGNRVFLPALAIPFLRRTSSAAARSPLASVSALLQSIIPALVFSRSSLTSAADISDIKVLSFKP